MKRYFLACVLVSIIVPIVFAQNLTPPDEVIQAANVDFKEYLKNAVTEETKTILGFDSKDDLGKAVLGTPFQIHILTSESINNYVENTPLQSILSRSDMWYFPIVIDNEIKMMLYVGKKNGEWMRAGMGSAGLSRQLQEITTKWSSSDGYTPMLVQQYDVGAYYFNIPQVNNFNLTETGANIMESGLNKRGVQLNTLSETISDLRLRVNR
jgi:hypothetical protein